MPHITKVVTINAEPEAVISYIADANHHPAFIEPLKTISDIKGDPKQPGTKWNWTFMMAGMEFNGESETTEYDASKVFGYKTSSGIVSEFKYAVEPENEGTKLTIDVEYKVPEGALAKIADKAIIERSNDDAAYQASQNIKAILEG